MMIFCPRCSTLMNPYADRCHSCHYELQDHERIPAPGKPIWQGLIGGPVQGLPVVCDGRVIFAWGDRQSHGGLTALDAQTGQLAWQARSDPESMAAGPSWDAHNLYAATQSLRPGALLYCYAIDAEQPVWQKSIPGDVWSPPVIWEAARVFAACDDGTIQCLDVRNGDVVPCWPIRIEKGRSYLQLFQRSLLVVHENGSLYRIDALRGSAVVLGCKKPATRLICAPHITGKTAYFFLENGTIQAVPLGQDGADWTSGGLRKISAPGTFHQGTLYIGGHDHYLHAFDGQTGKELWSADCESSIASTPACCEGFVFVGANNGCIYAYDQKDGTRLWSFAVGGSSTMVGSPVIHEGVLYFGTGDGQAFALFWHLGKNKYEFAGYHAAVESHWQEAGDCFAVAAGFADLANREIYYKNSEHYWFQANLPERAISMWESLGKNESIANACIRAGEIYRGKDNLRAAGYFLKASRMFWRLDQIEKLQNVFQEAAQLAGWPILRVKPVNTASLTQGEKGEATIRVENIGKSPAYHLNFTVGKSLRKTVNFKVLTPLLPDAHFDLTFEFIPTRSFDEIQVEVEFVEDVTRKEPFLGLGSLPVEAGPERMKIHLGDQVKSKIKVINQQNHPVDIVVGDTIFTELVIDLNADAEET